MDYLAFLEREGLDLAIFKGPVLVFSSRGEGLRPLLEAVEKLAHEPGGYVVADRVVGRAAALLALMLEPSEVHALVMSSGALSLLASRGVRAVARRVVEHIASEGGKPCPFEQALRDVEEPEEAYRIVKEMLEGGGQ